MICGVLFQQQQNAVLSTSAHTGFVCMDGPRTLNRACTRHSGSVHAAEGLRIALVLVSRLLLWVRATTREHRRCQQRHRKCRQVVTAQLTTRVDSLSVRILDLNRFGDWCD